MDSLRFTQETSKQNKKNVIGFLWENLEYAIASLLLSLSFCFLLMEMFRLRLDTESGLTGGIVGGLISIWNRIADTLGNTNFELLTKYQVANEGYGFFIVLIFVIVLFVAYLIIKSRYALGILLFVFPVFILGIPMGLAVKPVYVIAFALSLILALAVIKTKRGLLPGGLMVAILAGILSLSVNYFGWDAMDTRPVAIENFGVKAKTTIENAVYGDDPLGHGDLTAVERKKDSGLALEVSVEDPEPMYLKGYVGGVFNGAKWNQLSDASYYNAEGLMDELRERGFNPLGQMGRVSEFLYEDSVSKNMTVVNKGADSRIAFVPYEVTGSGTLASVSAKGGDYPYDGKFGKFAKYSYDVASSQTDNWTDEASRLFVMALGSLEGEEGTQAIADYMMNESHYNEFVYDNYTYVGLRDMETLATHIGEPYDISKGHLDYKVAIDSIRNYLEEEFIYTEKVAASENPLGEFFESGKGFDSHYATAATLMFRYYGIPARYVEGYLLTQEDIDSSKGQDISITKDRAHAWTEIYIDGLGFVPLEVTPEFYGVMPEADMSVGISNDYLVTKFEESFGGKAKPETDGGDGAIEISEGGNNALQITLMIIIAIICIALLVVIMRRLIPVIILWMAERKLMRSFREEEPKGAVARMYGYMEKRGYPVSKRSVDLGNKAAYSLLNISEDERSEMLKELERGKEEFKNRKRDRRNYGIIRKSASVSAVVLLICILLVGCASEKTGKTDGGTSGYNLDLVRKEVAEKVLENTGEATVASVGGDWAVKALSESGEEIPQDFYDRYFDNVRVTIKKNKGVLSDTYYTEYARVIIGLSAIGEGVRNVEGYDLIQPLEDFDVITAQGVTAAGFAIISSRIAKEKLEVEDRYIEFIIHEIDEGGNRNNPSLTDYVAMPAQALSMVEETEDVKKAINQALESLSVCQLDDGSLGNTESTVECIIALTQLGIDPTKDDRFIKAGNTLIDGLMKFYLGNGEFKHAYELDEADAMSTEKALLALSALRLFEQDEKLYD